MVQCLLARVLAAAVSSLPSPRFSPPLRHRRPEVPHSDAMWALRRAGNPLRICAQQAVTARSCANLEVLLNADAKSAEGHHGEHCQKPCCRHQSKPTVFQQEHSSGQFVSSRSFSSRASANSGDEEDEFSDLDVPPVAGNKDASLTSEDSSDEDAIGEIDLPDAKLEKEHMKKFQQSTLLKLILNVPRNEVTKALDKWAKDGNTFDRGEIYLSVLYLRRRKFFVQALKLLEWVEQSKQLELEERDYASRLDLIAKVAGLHRAEQYIDKIPASHRGEIVYRTLLANCVSEANVRKAEQVFKKMKDLGFPMTIFACDQLLLLYKRMDRKKIADILKMMEKENVKPSLLTYKLLADSKGYSKDIEGMEKVVESMQGEGIEPDPMFQAIIARQYIFNGHHEKAQAVLESMEGDDIKENRDVYRFLLPLYASLGKKDEVERIWKVCEDNTRADEGLTALEAFGRLGDVGKAEKVFEDMSKKLTNLGSRFYNSLLRVYANANQFDKCKDLVKRMEENGARIGTQTLDSFVKFYVRAGKVEKGDDVLEKLSQEYKLKPQYTSYLMLLDAYSKKGDIHNSEKVFNKMRQMGYNVGIRQYQLLLQAYLHAKGPAYGFRERMKADNIFPNGTVATLISATDPFREKDSISELLD